MSEMNSHEEMGEHDGSASSRDEQSARIFFAFLCFLIAIILLAIFLNQPLGFFSQMLVLLSIMIFGMLGVLTWEKRFRIINIVKLSIYEYDRVNKLPETYEQDEDEGNINGMDEASQLTPFEQLVQEALDSIPDEFHQHMEHLVVLVEDEPDEETLERIDHKEGYILLGLYQGVPLTALGHRRALLPERITIYQDNIKRYCHNNPERIRAQIQKTVLHEVAHHFGIDHEAMPIWIR